MSRTRNPAPPQSQSDSQGPKSITVNIGQVPGELEDFDLEPGTTVRQALKAAGLKATKSVTVQRNGEETSLDSVLTDQDTLMVIGKIRGNR